MDERAWLGAYLDQYRTAVFQPEVVSQLAQLKDLLKGAQEAGKKGIFAGNGGSAAMASHCAVDFTKMAGIRCINFNEANPITCFANDYGYEHWLEKALEFYAGPGDTAILISSSGKSKNMVNAARYAASHGMTVVTLTGCSSDNPLRALGHLNFWVDSRAYNVVEMTHHIWLLTVCDLLAGTTGDPGVTAPPRRRAAVSSPSL